MLDPTALLGLLPPLRDWLKDSKARRQLQDERGQHAVSSILRAVNETRLHVAAQARAGKSTRESEVQLSRLWTEAAAALHGLNDDLANRCKLKGAFWADPQEWTGKDLAEARILLKQVSDDADALLGWDKTSRSKTKQ